MRSSAVSCLHARTASIVLVLTLLAAPALRARADYDRSRYIGPDEIKPGMTGYGRTVMSGTRIDRFDFEVISVMDSWYPRQSIVLIRCAGLNLEHSGIVGGMSGSPCYVVDAAGNERLMGAVAYGWTYNKDPVCGVQPITQMLDIPDVRQPEENAQAAGSGRDAGSRRLKAPVDLPPGGLLFVAMHEPLDEASRFSVLNKRFDEIRRQNPPPARTEDQGGLRPLLMPLMVPGASPQSLALLEERFGPCGFEIVPSGGVGGAARAEIAENVRLEPGAALSIPFMTGDLALDGIGTCTAVIGNQVLGFGHSMFSDGSIELPMATGYIHTTIASVARSNKLGATLEPVGTLWGDEATGIFGTVGKAPKMSPVDVIIHDIRGRTEYHYDVVHEEVMTAGLVGLGVMESVYAHSNHPLEHTIRYSLEVEFEDLGIYRTSNYTSQRGTRGLVVDLIFPIDTMISAPLAERTRLNRARVEITVEKGARTAVMDQLTMSKDTYRPGETAELTIRWAHYRREPRYTTSTYGIQLPADLPDGSYELTIGSNRTHMFALQNEKPHLFRAETLPEALEVINLIASIPDNRVFLRLGLPAGGVAYDRTEMPELPSFHRKLLADTGQSSHLSAFTDTLVKVYETDFAVMGNRTTTIKVNRKAYQ